MTFRKTQPHVAKSPEISEHQSFLRVEEGSISRTLAFDCAHGYTQEEYMATDLFHSDSLSSVLSIIHLLQLLSQLIDLFS